MSNVLELLAAILVIIGALHGWRRGGWLQAVLEALGVAAVVLVVVLVLHVLGVTL